MRRICCTTAAAVLAIALTAVATTGAATDPAFTNFQGPILRQGFDKKGRFIVSSTLRFSSTERSTVNLVVQALDKKAVQLFISPIVDKVVHRDLTCPHYIKTNFRISKKQVAALRGQKGIQLSSSFAVSITAHEVKSGHASTDLNLGAGAYKRVVVPPCG